LTNYFNYFTEIEEHFQKARGTSLFLLSPLDWALIETWKNSEIPLEAVLRGIDTSFEKYHARKQKTQRVNSLAFCSQAVLTEAQLSADGSVARPADPSPFPDNAVPNYLRANAAELRKHFDLADIATRLEQLSTLVADTAAPGLEALEQELTVLEQKMIALARAQESDEAALESRRELDAQLRPYRGKMTAPQLAMLEQQYRDRRTLESRGLPRLSLFYLR
jgi:hypothetical protein